MFYLDTPHPRILCTLFVGRSTSSQQNKNYFNKPYWRENSRERSVSWGGGDNKPVYTFYHRHEKSKITEERYNS